jgi:N,N'-diacetyllegionaminate synthase
MTTRIGGKPIGFGEPTFIIAEAGVNHNGDLRTALELVDSAAAAGANCIKFQTYSVENLISMTEMKKVITPEILKFYSWLNDDRWLSEMDKRLTKEEYLAVIARCQEKGITFISSPWDDESVDLLEGLGVQAYKIGSGDLTNYPILKKIGSCRKPVILSVGMGSIEEIHGAIDVLRTAGTDQLILLHCIVSYPAEEADANLRFIHHLRDTFKVPVGFSDHTLSVALPSLAVAAGACAIEKHFTVEKDAPGLDQKNSMDIREFRDMVEEIRKMERVLGSYEKELTAVERKELVLGRRSINAKRLIKEGEQLASEMLCFLRPANGISPALLKSVLGKFASKDIHPGEAIQWESLK